MIEKKILAIETSCDDTSISLLEGVDVLSLKTHSQIEDHNKFGGVIPELASRLHTKNIFSLITLALKESNLSLNELDAIAVTQGPGLINTLQIGMIVAKALGFSLNIPVFGINHLGAHAFSPFIGEEEKNIPEKALVLIASGGHTILALKEGFKLSIIGETIDDAIGEAFDKVAKILGYDYPGGPIIDDIAKNYNGELFPCPISHLPNFNFTYSGLKSHVLKAAKEDKASKEAIAAGFQDAAIKQLINKINKAVLKYNINNIIIGGGVSANSMLRNELVNNKKLNAFIPKFIYSNDNAAMIGYYCALLIDFNLITPMALTEDASPKRKLGK